MRGADLIIETLQAAGVQRLFTLSGNQIMPIFDACVGTDMRLIHTRHEAAAVHMADAWGRLTGEPGIALITAGPGLANALSALYVASMAESPLVLLSGHAPIGQLGRGAFQEMPQAEMAAHVTKASWTATDASELGKTIARAIRIAKGGRPGPVQVSLPADILEEMLDASEYTMPESSDFQPELTQADSQEVSQILDALSIASKPLILAGPAFARGEANDTVKALTDGIGVPSVAMESPRGINDPSLGAFAEVLSQADLIVLLGKKLDFMLQFGDAPAINPDCKFIHIDAEYAALAHTQKLLGDSSRLSQTLLANPVSVAQQLLELADARGFSSAQWRQEVENAVAYRPSSWDDIQAPTGEPLHAVEIFRVVQDYLDKDADAIYVSDGGEVGQWAQATLNTTRRVINGPSGSIGSNIPFAIATREAFPDSRVVTIMGDGTFGFHATEFDTAVRNNIPFIAIVCNDSAWNAEYQIQLRDYGEDRLIGCELLPTRYDKLVEALGGYGEQVTSTSELAQAIKRAHASALPACINVTMEKNAAPVIRRG